MKEQREETTREARECDGLLSLLKRRMEEEAAASSAGFGSADTFGMKTDNSAPRSYERRHRKEGGKREREEKQQQQPPPGGGKIRFQRASRGER